MRTPLMSREMREHIGQCLLPFVSAALPDVHFRVKKCYAFVLAAGRLVSSMIDINHMHHKLPVV